MNPIPDEFKKNEDTLPEININSAEIEVKGKKHKCRIGWDSVILAIIIFVIGLILLALAISSYSNQNDLVKASFFLIISVILIIFDLVYSWRNFVPYILSRLNNFNTLVESPRITL